MSIIAAISRLSQPHASASEADAADPYRAVLVRTDEGDPHGLVVQVAVDTYSRSVLAYRLLPPGADADDWPLLDELLGRGHGE